MKVPLSLVAVLLLLFGSTSAAVAVTPAPSGYTFYLIQITIVNTKITYQWTNTDACGSFVPGGQAQPDSAIWNFTVGLGTPCTGSSGPTGMITAVMTDSQGESITCTYPNGSANFNGTASADCTAVSTPYVNSQTNAYGFSLAGVLAYLVLSETSTTTSSTTTTSTTTTPSPTTTQVACSPKNITVSAQSKCTALVAGNSPTGLVQWAYTSTGGGSITFPAPYTARTCELANGACFVMVMGNSTGSVTIKAQYSGDYNNLPSGGSTLLGIGLTSTTSSGTQTSSSGTGGIPEFPPQLTVATVLVAIIALAYLFERSRMPRDRLR